MGDFLTWVYLAGIPMASFYALRLWVLDARERGAPVSKSEFGQACVMCGIMGIIWPVATCLVGVGLINGLVARSWMKRVFRPKSSS
jgi:hypothetical protein